ncbi:MULTISPECIES: RNA polymerase sigma factor [unclassified Curtobacterium]|uniref:RNA polymerase sigma factor n=1 Tax=unclassified Curtobacterium TaxID=257496 RepID=UPI00381C4C8C
MSTDQLAAARALTIAHQEEWPRVVGTLVRRFGSLDLAEDAAADAFAIAVERWPREGVPTTPGAWLTTTATRRAIDVLRRESSRERRHRESVMLRDDGEHVPVGIVDDDRLRLFFVCCHPILGRDARVVLTLRIIGGLTVADIARAFLVPEATIARRITRAKAKIAATGVPWRVPEREELAQRSTAVLDAVFLIFTEGHQVTRAADKDDPIRPPLMAEVIRLGRLLHTLLPDDGEVAGLLALMLLTAARTPARTASPGLLMIDEQDRTRWDHSMAGEGLALVRARIDSGEVPGKYQLLAAVNAVHITAPSAGETDWTQVLALYDQLIIVAPSPVAELNRAVAVAEVHGPQAGLDAVLPLRSVLERYDALHAVQAGLLQRLGNHRAARAAWDRAISLTDNAAVAAAFARRRDELSDR